MVWNPENSVISFVTGSTDVSSLRRKVRTQHVDPVLLKDVAKVHGIENLSKFVLDQRFQDFDTYLILDICEDMSTEYDQLATEYNNPVAKFDKIVNQNFYYQKYIDIPLDDQVLNSYMRQGANHVLLDEIWNTRNPNPNVPWFKSTVLVKKLSKIPDYEDFINVFKAWAFFTQKLPLDVPHIVVNAAVDRPKFYIWHLTDEFLQRYSKGDKLSTWCFVETQDDQTLITPTPNAKTVLYLFLEKILNNG